MKYNKTLALVPALLLAACGGDEQNVTPKASPGSVIYSYPADGQLDVSPKADIVLRFSDALTEEKTDLKNKISLKSGDSDIVFSVEKIDGGKSLKLSTDGALQPASKYSVTFDEPLKAAGNRTIRIPDSLEDSDIHFSTRGSYSGLAELTETDDVFKVAQQIPASDKDKDDSPFQAMNFSTFRFILTQPVHPDWDSEELGGSIELLDQDNQPVPTTVLVKGNRITVDPCVTKERIQCGSKDDILNSGETYTLKINNLASLTSPGDEENENQITQAFEYTPRDTGPTVVLKQSATDSGLANGMSKEAATKSILNGQPINGVTLNSVLQGVAGPSQQTGDMFAELAYAPGFEDNEALPLRIPKGSVLSSTSLDVLVGGVVPALDAATGELQTTGDIKVTMLSDASGYMSPNPYTDDRSAPRQITLFMDVSMNAEEGQPNAALSQDLMGVELRGIALVRDGVLTIDAIGMVEPALLGQEYTDSTIAFHLEANTDADSAIDADGQRELDKTGPSLVSWMPGDKDAIPNTRQSMQRPGDPVILFFNEPLAPSSIAGGMSLYADGQELTVSNGLNAELDGTALLLNPEGGLKPGVNYTVSAFGVTDLAGNKANINQLDFKLDGKKNSPIDAPPLALTTYPGYPCQTDHEQLNLEEGILGVCYSKGNESVTAEAGVDNRGDVLPVSKMPADRPITVVFSQPMNLDSIRLGETFIVQKVDSDGENEEEVAGRLEKNNQRIRFYPEQPWEPEEFYQYTMKVDRESQEAKAAPSCKTNKPNSICGINNFLLKADLLEGLNAGNGNGNERRQSLKIYFEGVKAQNTVFTPLRNLPVRDTNANFRIDCDSNDNPDCEEPFDHKYIDPNDVTDKNQVSGWLPSANATKLSVLNNQASTNLLGNRPAQVGCSNDETCPKSKFIYQTYALNTEVKGPGIWTDPKTGKEQEGILVDLYPTLLATSSVNTYVDLGITEGEVPTNTQIIRMRYSEDPSCKGENNCRRNQLIPGAIVKGDEGQPVFKTRAELMLDAPEMEVTLNGSHDLYTQAFYFDLEGDVTFFDDGRMQIEQRNTNPVYIDVKAKTLGFPGLELISIDLPLQIPVGGTYLNFISNPVKDLPAQYSQKIAE